MNCTKLLFVLVLYSFIVVVNNAEYHEYCIIGSGPAGLQIAHFLQSTKRDYIVFEKHDKPGFFFFNFPRHRKLISINKRHTGEKNRKFNLRHDWNSLLSNNKNLRFTRYSNEMFPSADLMVQYLNDFYQQNNIHVKFNTKISNLRTVSTSEDVDTCLRMNKNSTHCSSTENKSFSKYYMKHRNKIRFRMVDQKGNPYSCSIMLIATGLSIPNIPEMHGIELAEGYETVSINPDDFEGQTVLLLGRGNSAFEVAQSIYQATNFIHMISRSRVRSSFATHYVGDLRAINNQILDSYQLKSLDALLETDLREHALRRRVDGKIQLIEKPRNNSNILYNNRQTSLGYDRVIRCLGFKFDKSFLNKSINLTDGKGREVKYPKIDGDYQSVDVKHLYFVGTLAHSLDFRKSSGGFIHGFRYTARALYRILENRYHQKRWPSKMLTIGSLLNYIIKRMNEADGIYQMFSELGLNAFELIVLNMQYGANYSGPGRDVFAFDRATASVNSADRSNFLHPVFYYYKSFLSKFNNSKTIGILPEPDKIHHVLEDLLTLWIVEDTHILPLQAFLEDILNIDLQQHSDLTCVQSLLSKTYDTLTTNCLHNMKEKTIYKHRNFLNLASRE
ncbi:unnamed protein product [Didymodactylos carnosus]|uniref:FAD-dependent oxidoreductase domain-containing protein 2 n=1 Tax=Didymodactylos carnosus TaxID=1234261 RepID=A0A814Q1E5_9BILA|nr:unnamed protein product [Didymodactylos carnosus]CAF1113113.1 unnamed protein product [Didymodactylos carnosus]CAF3686169.1 unnamed protein product [Didymodactylos carnosus]CAF3877288.1 unnamed protein product [Didymodactylos carnosus]